MKKLPFLVLITLLTFTTSFAQSKYKLLDSLFNTFHKQRKFNGNVLIAENGVPFFERSYGKADERANRMLNSNSVFELASVSKQFTAVGIVLLHKQGKLNYEDDIAKYIPELAFYGHITVRQLLNHTGGLPDYMALFESNWDSNKFATNEDIIKEYARLRPAVLFLPNAKYTYSNTGYALLASIIERISGETYGNFLHRYIFKPLKMKHTKVYRSRYQPEKTENYALGYVQDSTGKKVLLDSYGKRFYTYYLDGIVGDGMVNSTTGDLLRWDQALYSDRLVNSDDKVQILKASTTTDGKTNTYGFGWIVSNNKSYGTIASHSGGWAGYITYIERQLDRNKTIIMLQNNDTELIQMPVTEIRHILYEEKVEIDDLNAIQLTTDAMGKYTGVYVAADFPMKLKIYVNNGALYGHALAEKQEPFKLDAYENQTFMHTAGAIKLVFDPAHHTINFSQGKSIKVLFTKEP
jgi:CubicO group peptidase (beta-lactamase class C family)